MNEVTLAPEAPVATAASIRPITIAVTAIGGQGGGVLADWIVELSGENGYLAQYTSVPGVAQRTGSTVYYLELFPLDALPEGSGPPIMALMPAAGDVDVVISSELMEAGRAMMRGFVTPDRTTLIASSHRIYGILEKSALGDGTANPDAIRDAARTQARQFIEFDMAALADDTGSVISSVLFGALAGSGVLPFDRAQYEAVIRHAGRAVQTNLAGFAAGFEGALQARAPGDHAPVKVEDPDAQVLRGKATTAQGKALVERIIADFPKPAHVLLYEGAKRCADYQDQRYAQDYLDRMAGIARLDAANGGAEQGWQLTVEAARFLALWMSYEDVIRVADLKTRGSRFARVREEVRAAEGQLVYMTEFMHPRFQEVCETMPAGIGGWMAGQSWLERMTAPLFASGRFISTAKLRGFLLLSLLAALRPIRRTTLRYRHEMGRLQDWLDRIVGRLPASYSFAVELVKCQRLIKGYSDTHARGLANFGRVMDAVDQYPGMTAKQLADLRAAALADEHGHKLTAAIAAL